ncbi:3-hydroxyacyl-CoA dehydrogenase NAD-binding domain-containing protein [Cognatishimia sp. F0-27]|uniref:3-hydroxyacyl-CoA dehydrogenase NAD-binding domain-containing protein n=1 Tax=Cognatishimia sp. F0-27 TaxID=2816855 RepID=UPI001D0C3CE4|nr:3-hydroxyacyl-CoA dehydrogenase NAD-binding domain-containing protein [Cognatishimia sp. F0-27]MCC1493635.1 enoyl-CoA hydratase/isomerase family protein [Cognatishimia sp. F0-27]
MTQSVAAVTWTIEDGIADIVIDNPPVNALGQAVRRGLCDAIDAAEAAQARGAVIHAAGRTFPAGADIREFGKPPLEPLLPDVCTRIERSDLLVVAALHGTALGGGLEVALGADYRIAVPTAKVGLPEVLIGVMPGAGGTQRLPRLIGVPPAIDVITTGRKLGADEALALGILDRVEEGAPRDIGMAYLRDLLAAGAPRRPVGAMPAPEPVDFDAAYDAALKKARGQLSPAQAVRGIQAACELPFDAGMARERALFRELMETDQREALIHAFFGERAVSNLPELRDVTARPVAQIGVIGGGTMGAGIATAALLAGLTVTVIERDDAAIQAAKERIARNLSGALKRGKIDQAQFDHLTGPALALDTGYAALAEADLVIEAVFEDMAVKTDVFQTLDAVCKPGAVLATNTSYLDINEIARATRRPEDVIGLHFFSPAHVMRLLEVVVADKTAPDVIATGFALGKRLGKVSVRAGVCDGFIGNRILMAYRTATDHMVLDGASPFEIDRVLRGFGFAMGPFQVSDLAGLDIGWATRKRLAPTRDPRERVPAYADKLCEAGHFGQKTGRGYYVYGDGGPVPNPDVERLITEERAVLGITPKTFSDVEILRRVLCAMVNEASRVVEEGIARCPRDVDMVFLTGYGFPRHRGGPMKWADLDGLPGVLADIERFAQDDAYFWQPAPMLAALVAEGRSFDDLNRAAAP